jgi:hypothetical protein
MRRETYNAMAWGSVAAIFFSNSRIAGIIALITWCAVIVARRPFRQSKRKANRN